MNLTAARSIVPSSALSPRQHWRAQRPPADSPHRSLYMLRAGDREARSSRARARKGSSQSIRRSTHWTRCR